MKFMEALRYRPTRLWKLQNLTDFSGYGISATRSSAEVRGIPLVPDVTNSQVIRPDRTLTLPSNIYKQGLEEYDFSVIATIYPVVKAGVPSEQAVVSHPTALDGLTVNGTVVSFSTQYATTGSATASYDVETLQKLDLVGVHNKTKNSLYVNGVLVAEVDISDAQQADTYFHSGTNMSSGYTTGTQEILINMIGFYPRALHEEEIGAIYTANNTRVEGDPARMYEADSITFGSDVRTPYLYTGWFTEDDWRRGEFRQVNAEDTTLYAAKIDDLTLAGEWYDAVNVFDGDTAVSINSINLDWDGENVTVSVSLDSDSWTPVTKGTNISIYSANTTPTDDSFFVKVSFPAGETDAYIENLRVHGYTGNTVLYENRTITYPNQSTPLEDLDPMLLHGKAGVKLNGGQLTISTDATGDAPMTVKTVEVWWRRVGAATVSANITGADATYVNGTTTNSDRTEEWMVKHFTEAAGFTGDFTFSGNIQIAKVAFYPNVLSAAEVAAVVSNYAGVQTVSAGSPGSVIITEPVTSAAAYGHDWEIQAS